MLLSKLFLKWLAISNIISWVVAFFIMNNWLQNFAYKTAIGIWVFVVGGLMALIIATITVSLHTVKAANTNPAESLRYE